MYKKSYTKQPRHAVIDTDTGDLFDIVLVPRKWKVTGGWMKFYLQPLKLEALHGQSCKVLLYLERNTGWHNVLPSAAETATALGLDRTAVARAYRELLDVEAIVKVRTHYHLNPQMGWRGSDRDLDAFSRELWQGQPGYNPQQLVAPQ